MTSHIEVSVLLATYNGALHIEEQLRSLSGNSTPFTVHWLDDHSTDGTREVVRTVAASLRLEMREWKCDERLRVPGAFFWLLENVRSDVYLFCDHDDIWQPGKIDATAKALTAGPETPIFCYSEPFLFESGARGVMRRYYDVTGVLPERAQALSRAFVLNPAVGNTVGISRVLRDLLLTHLPVARSHAIMHDWWLYLLALATGGVRFMVDVPTSLYRQHSSNFFGVGRNKESRSLADRWNTEQRFRRQISTQARGFLLATAIMSRTQALDAMASSARSIASIDRRRSLRQLAHLAYRGELPLPLKRALWFSTVSLLSDAAPLKAAEDGSRGLLQE